LDSDLHAKISDFGFAKTKEHSKSNSIANTMGTIPWAAPEYLTFKRVQERNEKGDVFSFGVIVWELITRQIPWKAEGYSSEDIQQAIEHGFRLEIPENCPKSLKKLMANCWKDSMKILLF
jgi:fyn-related kinase